MTGSYLLLLVLGALLASTAMAVLWAIQLRTADASHVDVGWAIGIAGGWLGAVVWAIGNAGADAGNPQPTGLRRLPTNDERLRAAPAPCAGGSHVRRLPLLGSRHE